jgi:DNA polymerase III epsilon subunit-like protein
MTIKTYRSWDAVPEGLLSKTSLKREGLLLAEGQEPVAYKLGDKKRKYPLYDKSQAIPRPQPDPAKVERGRALAKASLAKRTCKNCGLIQATRPGKRSTRVWDGFCDYCLSLALSYEDWLLVVDRSHAILQNDWQKVLVLDTETNGLGGQILELAMINAYGNTVYEQKFAFEYREPYSQQAYHIHGIALDELEGQPTYASEWPKIAAILNEAAIVAIYNSKYDLSVMEGMAKEYGLDFDPTTIRSYCIMNDYAVYVGEKRRNGGYKWQALNGGHTAGGDCVAALDVLRRMAGAYGGAEYLHKKELVNKIDLAGQGVEAQEGEGGCGE